MPNSNARDHQPSGVSHTGDSFAESDRRNTGYGYDDGSYTDSMKGQSGAQAGAALGPDEHIGQLVRAALTKDDHVDAANITVDVKDGEVTLTGTVADRSMMQRAEDAARSVPGVRSVRTQLAEH